MVEFKEAMDSMVSALAAGYSMEKRHHRSVSRYEVAAFGGYEDDERTLGHTAKNFSASAIG